jgi:ADP-ribose pyrophosphatase YjhB (NUDIX family)
VALAAAALYRRFPIFGRLPGAIAIIREGELFLVIDRVDGLGFGLPGGLARWREAPECTVRREVREETGLTVVSATFCFSFCDDNFYPVQTHVYDATVSGAMRSSHEGEVRKVTLDQLRNGVIASQRPVVDYLERRQQSKVGA